MGYINRIYHVPGSAESVVGVFRENGFTVWGGYWRDRIDYQHFQIPKAIALESAKTSTLRDGN